MSHCYAQTLYHLVWATKGRHPFITKPLKDRLYQYMAGCIKAKEGQLCAIGGMPDHIHILIAIPPKVSVAETVRSIKSGSSKWVNQTWPNLRFSWQAGYGVFSVSLSNLPAVVRYIQNQEEHHRGRNFLEEFQLLLKKHKVSFDERDLYR